MTFADELSSPGRPDRNESMDQDSADPPIKKAYTEKYPRWTDVRVTNVVEHVFGGTLVTIRATTGKGIKHSELCFIGDDSKVTIFDSAEDLARGLEARAKLGWVYRIFTRPILSGIVFLFLLIAVFIIGMRPKDKFSPEAFTALAGVLGTAAGFFFASPAKK